MLQSLQKGLVWLGISQQQPADNYIGIKNKAQLSALEDGIQDFRC